MKQSSRPIAYDCQYFLGDRPCVWHKQTGVVCECEHYNPSTRSLLIIKLDAMGDVLRTTCLLPVIAEAWPRARITWITREESVPLLRNSPYVTECIPYGPDALVQLAARSFDRVVNLDAGKISSALSAMADAKERIGYVLDRKGYVTATNPAAQAWLEMGVFDDLKKANSRTYQEIMCAILGLPVEGLKYVLQLTEDETAEGKAHLASIGVDLDRKIIGIHTGAGGRWPLKQWNEEKFLDFIPELAGRLDGDGQIVLFGGPLEKELNERLAAKAGVTLFDAGCENSVRHFAALIAHCSVVLCSDSLAMHVALAMGRRVVVLFGPTSSEEIELFGLGEKVVPDLDCVVCYRQNCDKTPTCMDVISVERVSKAVVRQLRFTEKSRP